MLPPTPWSLPDPARAPAGVELLGTGADLAPATVLNAYARGLFPMPVNRGGTLGWWSPDPRAVLPLAQLHRSRSLRRTQRRYRVSFDTDFAAVLAGCADPARPHGWISAEIAAAYRELHRLGWAHSVEVWGPGGDLVGGLYGLELGGLFAGESMFHAARDASKVALAALVQRLHTGVEPQRRLLDVQWSTEHLASLGVVELDRPTNLMRLADSLTLPPVFG